MNNPAEANQLPDDPANNPFWEQRYREGVTPWDLGEAAPPFVDLMEGPDAPRPGKMIALGSGRGHDPIFFAQKGFDVTGVDFAPSAVEAARKAARQAGVDVAFIQGDIFTLGEELNHKFDYVLEHTCFAAIPVVNREEYVQLVRRLLNPGGLYIAILFSHGRPGGPPFTTDTDEVRRLFEPYFRIETLEAPARSAEGRQGKELFAIMTPRPEGQAE
jgi:SAM-dependent methyltransferase